MTLPIDPRAITTVLYDEIVAAKRFITNEERIEKNLKHGEVDAHEVKISQFLQAGKRHLAPQQQIAYDEIAITSRSKETLYEVDFLVNRLRRLGVESLRNINSRERAQIDEDYQFYKRTLEKLAAETKYQNVNIMGLNADTMEIAVGSPALSLLGYDQFRLIEGMLPSVFYDVELDDEDQFFHNVTTDKNAALSLHFLDGTLGRIGSLYSALKAVEQRNVAFVRSYDIGKVDSPVLKDRFAALEMAQKAASAITEKAEIAHLIHTSAPALGLSLLAS